MAWSAAAAAPPRSTCAGRRRVSGRAVVARRPRPRAGAASLVYHRCRSAGQRRCWSASGPTPTAARRSASRCSRERWDDCVRDRPGAGPRRRPRARRLRGLRRPRRRRRHARLAGRMATASTLPIMLDSTEPGVVEAGLEMLGAGAVVNSVNFEDGDGPGRGSTRIMQLVTRARRRGGGADHRRGGHGPDRRVQGARRRAADRRPRRGCGLHAGTSSSTADLPDRHRAGGDPPRRPRDARGHPEIKRRNPGGADHPRALQHLLRAQPGRAAGAQLGLPARGVQAGLDAAIVHASKILPIPDPRRAARGRARPDLRPAPSTRRRARLRPAVALPVELFEGVDVRRPRPRRGRTDWPRCRSRSGSSGASSTASQRPRSRPRRGAGRRARPWRSSTRSCSTA